MCIGEIRELIEKREATLPESKVNEIIRFFMDDSDGELEYIRDFVNFGFMLAGTKNSAVYDNLHLCNQKYIASLNTHPEMKKIHLPYLYLKEIEYYAVVNSYSECINFVNRIMDLDDVPDFAMAAALSQAVDIFMTCGLSYEAEKYVNALRAFTNLCDLPARNLIMLDCNLMHAFATMGKRREYEHHRRNISRYREKDLNPAIISITRLYVLGSEAIIDKAEEPSQEYLREFCALMDNGDFASGITASFAEPMVPILKWVKNRLAIPLLVRYTLNMIKHSDTFSDKIEMYSVLVDEFDLDKKDYAYIFSDYYDTLRSYYENVRETHRHEVVGEMMSYAVEKQYRQKALTDELTGLGNRAAYEIELDSVKAECTGDTLPDNLIVLAMDVNGLKGVNDNFGHQAGDDYIRGAADCCVKAMGNYGHIFRVGGDEFNAIIRAKNFPIENVVAILRENLDNWIDSYGNELSMAIGYAVSAKHQNLALDQLINIADVAMYKDKSLYYQRTGKDRRTR